MPSYTHQIEVDGQYKPEANRYHLYLNKGCPFAHRTHIALYLKGLEDAIDVSYTEPGMGPNGWIFSNAEQQTAGSTVDKVNGFVGAREIYLKNDPAYEGKYTVPVLWDTKTSTIVNNESAEILRIFNNQLNNLAKHPEVDLYPESLKSKIDELFTIYNASIIMGVYGPGYATTQADYETKTDKFFAALDDLEKHLGTTRYVAGSQLTELDIKLFVTLIRFEPAYYGAYKLNLKTIHDYPVISNYLKDLYQKPQFNKTVDFDHIKKIYYLSPNAPSPKIVPRGPNVDWLKTQHNRANLD
ncbi:hypothetical protein PPL_10828 [Heterostelium album PN500]|uniref:GST C-terminal domain-containing protein n=1 Tax=Heterostelium pallidum (strain ATCC 26659 / Pp 5 / PN500) TaxID=670386 RepID=D3BS36_HETP5|nr:hypothetical protein PPL_10828 [Heterostelium album PN500]EFA75773.1 hypothetical protein PPL_10828 [Heterostelium album PN500]|eukprot:XP_020427907.1 hypothetical protein PPL_10828 [Heterostelium album PN500]